MLGAMRRMLALAIVLFAGCPGNDTSVKKAGEPCMRTSECDEGLLCDLSVDPPVCSSQGVADAAPPDAMIDAHPLRDAATP
jgi:hypothetical protein